MTNPRPRLTGDPLPWQMLSVEAAGRELARYGLVVVVLWIDLVRASVYGAARSEWQEASEPRARAAAELAAK